MRFANLCLKVAGVLHTKHKAVLTVKHGGVCLAAQLVALHGTEVENIISSSDASAAESGATHRIPIWPQSTYGDCIKICFPEMSRDSQCHHVKNAKWQEKLEIQKYSRWSQLLCPKEIASSLGRSHIPVVIYKVGPGTGAEPCNRKTSVAGFLCLLLISVPSLTELYLNCPWP